MIWLNDFDQAFDSTIQVSMHEVSATNPMLIFSTICKMKNTRMLKKTSEIENDKLREKIIGSVEIIRRNQKIIALDLSISDEGLSDINNYLKRKPDCEKLKSLAADLEMKSMITELDKSGDKQEVEKTRQSAKVKQTEKDAVFTPDLFG